MGVRIVEEEQHGEARAQYGTRLIKTLAEQLMPKYGSTFSKRNLDYFRQFYLCFNDLEIVNTCVHNLTWSHFRSIIQVADPKAREWYVKEASELSRLLPQHSDVSTWKTSKHPNVSK